MRTWKKTKQPMIKKVKGKTVSIKESDIFQGFPNTNMITYLVSKGIPTNNSHFSPQIERQPPCLDI